MRRQLSFNEPFQCLCKIDWSGLETETVIKTSLEQCNERLSCDYGRGIGKEGWIGQIGVKDDGFQIFSFEPEQREYKTRKYVLGLTMGPRNNETGVKKMT